ncbi:MAG: TIGR02452 family protein [Myxococcota bacterium]
MPLADVTRQTLAILEAGAYTAPSGARVDIGAAVASAVEGTVLYRPEHLSPLSHPPRRGGAPRFEVTDETTAAAARRLVAGEGVHDVVALNFASAKNPGGGFLGAAKAQEEDLARASALYPCLLRAPGYYEANRACGTMLYTDHIIWSPRVPFFRDDKLALLETPFLLSVLTAPAPNAGEAERRGPVEHRGVGVTLRTRAAKVLAAAVLRNHRVLLLGAWGCGVFRNDPTDVAAAFGGWLAHPAFTGCFDRVVFAVYDPSKERRNLRAFQARFGA